MTIIITILIFVFIVIILTIILLTINYLFSTNKHYSEKGSIYECGFIGIFHQTRTQFTISFFLVAVLFIVFDLEVIILYPLITTLDLGKGYTYVIVVIFFSVLTLGFIYELSCGVLKFSNNKSEYP